MLGLLLQDRMKQGDKEAIRGVFSIREPYGSKWESLMECLLWWTLHRNSFNTHQTPATTRLEQLHVRLSVWVEHIHWILWDSMITIDLLVPAVPTRRAHFLLCSAGTCPLPLPKPVPRWTTPSAVSDAWKNKLKLFPNESSHKTEDSLQPGDSSEQKQGTKGTKSRSIQWLTEEQVWRGLPWWLRQ